MQNNQRRHTIGQTHSFLLSDEELSSCGDDPLVLKSPTLPPSSTKRRSSLGRVVVSPEPNSPTTPSFQSETPTSPKMEATLGKIFKDSFMPALRTTSSSSSSTSSNPSAPTNNPTMVSVDVAVMQKLLSRIDSLETKLETISSQPPTSTPSVPAPSDDQSVLTSFTQSQSANDVSMAYRVLTPPSSITGGMDSSSASSTGSSPPRRRSRLESDLIENLASKIDTNYEHLTRLDHVVQAQEETIRRQQEQLHNMLARPELLSLAPLRIQRFMKSVSMRKKKRRIRAANLIKSRLLVHKHTQSFQKNKSAALKIQRWYRCYHLRRTFLDIKAKATTLQALLRGSNVRRPQRIKHLYNLYTSHLRAIEEQCPITMSTITSPIICIADGYTYEKSAIMTWVKQNGSSPLTREPVTTEDLIRPDDLVEKFKETRTGLDKITRQSIIYKLERDNLQQSHAMTKMKLTLSANEVDELKALLEKESGALLKAKAENVKLKQELASMSAKTDAVESDNVELRTRLNSTFRRARSVQYERDEFQVQMASLSAKADALNTEVEENNELHERLLGELKVAQTPRTKGNAALLLQMAVAQRNSRSLLEETVWDSGGDGVDADAGQPVGMSEEGRTTNRSGLEEGTWDDNESDQDSDEEEDHDDVQKFKPQLVEGSRSSLEDECWKFGPPPVETPTRACQRNVDNEKKMVFGIEELRSLISTNKIGEIGHDQRTAEFLLSDRQFRITFGMEKKEYKLLPKWRKLEKKREVELF